jgi:hypothetical protein
MAREVNAMRWPEATIRERPDDEWATRFPTGFSGCGGARMGGAMRETGT